MLQHGNANLSMFSGNLCHTGRLPENQFRHTLPAAARILAV
ncbi:hypothetical protein [Eikenella sp. HMSC071B05]|nr:hypothetical protein [Eikenella sp. HMSC071B05]